MKKIFNILLLAATALGFTTSCSDVPAPYDIYADGNASYGKTLPYKSASLNTGWTTHTITADEPWSQGSSYTQATGYQDWDGTGSKVNHEVESYLISPALNLKCESGKVKFNFDQTIRYTNNVSGWANNHKIYISKDYDGMDFDAATWEELPFTPEASPYSDWTLYTSGDIQIPDAYVNHDSVYVAFWFYAPASASTTWELENFFILEGEAEDTPDNPDTPTSEATGSGTVDDPYNVAGVIAYASTLATGASSPNQVYFKGIISSIKEVSASYGNCTFYVSDDGTSNNTFYVYRALGLGNKNVTDENFIKVGYEVVVCGTITNYNGTLETAQKDAYVYSVNGTGSNDNPDPTPTEGSGDGTANSPYNVAAAISFTSALAADVNSDPVYIEGIICDNPKIDTGYGNATFHISDDGTDGTSFYVYRTLDLGNQKFTDANKLKKGDKVVIYGPLVNYKGNTPETAASKTYLISINGSAEGGGSNNDNPDTPSGNSDGVSISGTTVTLTNAAATPGSESITIDLNTLGYENAADMGTITLNDGTTIVFDAGSNKNTPKFYSATKGARVYANNTITFNGKSAIATIVMTCDSYNGTDYVGNATATISASGNTLVYTNASADAGTQLRVQTITITYAQ